MGLGGRIPPLLGRKSPDHSFAKGPFPHHPDLRSNRWRDAEIHLQAWDAGPFYFASRLAPRWDNPGGMFRQVRGEGRLLAPEAVTAVFRLKRWLWR